MKSELVRFVKDNVRSAQQAAKRGSWFSASVKGARLFSVEVP